MSDSMSFALASSVMAATEKVVRQALEGAWGDVPRTLEHRRELLDQLSAKVDAGDRAWLTALRQAVAESDTAVQAMTPKPAVTAAPAATGEALHTALRQSLINTQSGVA